MQFMASEKVQKTFEFCVACSAGVFFGCANVFDCVSATLNLQKREEMAATDIAYTSSFRPPKNTFAPQVRFCDLFILKRQCIYSS